MVSKSLLGFLVIHVIITEICVTQGAVPYGFRSDYSLVSHNGQQAFYKIHLIPLTWPEAKRTCALEDAILFHPDNLAEFQAVKTFLKSFASWITEIYVSLNDIEVEGMYQTIDGKPISLVYNKWKPNETNGGDSEDCIVLKLDKGEIVDHSCSIYNKYFVCKKLKWNESCNMSSPGYTFSDVTGSCYKLHTKPLKWVDAHATCVLEQSNLAMIDSQLEKNYLVNLTKDAATRYSPEVYQKGIFHLGFHNRYDDGWTTVDGQPLENDNGSWWGDYYPGAECNNKCGAMFYNGDLVNIDCDTKSFFICEHKPVFNAPIITSTLPVDSTERVF